MKETLVILLQRHTFLCDNVGQQPGRSFPCPRSYSFLNDLSWHRDSEPVMQENLTNLKVWWDGGIGGLTYPLATQIYA